MARKIRFVNINFNSSKVLKRGNLIFEVLNTDSFKIETVIGEVSFPLNKIENQDEYDILLEIPDEEDEQVINSKIDAKITFIWSYFKLYQEMHTKSEKLLNSYKNMINKSNQLLENLNGKFI